MMTYDEIKNEYPLGCEVKLEDRELPDSICIHKGITGKLLAILDPSKHGPKCLLFKIESPEGGKISNESAASTIRRKLSFSGNTGMLSWSAPEECLEKRGVLHSVAVDNSHGLLKWIEPSDVKERVDLEKGAAEGLKRLFEGQKEIDPEIQGTFDKNWMDLIDNSTKKEAMDRTEELKRILRPGMKVKLKETTEDCHPKIDRGMPPSSELGKWTKVCEGPKDEVDANGHWWFRDKEDWGWPLTMIEKVEGEQEATPDTIPVPREKVKEKILWDKHNTPMIESFRDILGDDLIDDLLQEIEEEEKYVNLDEALNTGCSHNKKALNVAKGYTPEIHKEGGQYVVKFKREG